jgi:ubiquinone/menaquinone biosynthesis C-methylase UbiE
MLLSEKNHAHRRFPERLSFMLDNPIRRLLNPPERLVSKLGVQKTHTVVDFGCGPGFYTIPIAHVAARTIGVDVSPIMLQKVNEQAKKNRVTIELIQSDGTSIDMHDRSVDMILLVHVFHEISDREEVLHEFTRILQPTGRIIIVEKTRSGFLSSPKLGPPVINKEKVLRELANNGFEHDQTVEYGADSLIIVRKA